MHFNIFTLFPDMFGCYFGASILERVQAMGLLDLAVHNIRDFAHDRHRVTDEPPYGGGGGMILKPEPIFAAVEAVSGSDPAQRGPVILLTPQGRLFTQAVAAELAGFERLNLIAGRYEGVDERVRSHLVTDEISVGDYVLTGGELAAMIVVDAVARLLPGALGAVGAAETDSHATGLLEGPHYTRPASFRGLEVPAVLRSGHAANIERWRREQALRRTWQRRPELLLTAPLDEADRYFLATLADESVQAAG
ncbi:MAG: tRNA (guanosine(37)-N1)-methyltransferase TrmD [Anaerolineae bacterium]|nr:tRNA (guanosine(37)-N1)-methyltransferase TrmD [Anaerolineae bacterium]